VSTDSETRDGYTKERELKADGRYVIYYTFSGETSTARQASGTGAVAPGEGQVTVEEGADV
jgi:hypothetical protein